MHKYPITALIPQRAPIIMVDAFLGIEGNVSRTRLTIRQDNLFVEGDYFSECGIMEHIAQSAAARVGFLFTEQGKPVPLGYIGSINQCSLIRLPRVHETLETEIRVIQEVFNITLIEAECCVNGSPVATCRMKIFLDHHEA